MRIVCFEWFRFVAPDRKGRSSSSITSFYGLLLAQCMLHAARLGWMIFHILPPNANAIAIVHIVLTYLEWQRRWRRKGKQTHPVPFGALGEPGAGTWCSLVYFPFMAINYAQPISSAIISLLHLGSCPTSSTHLHLHNLANKSHTKEVCTRLAASVAWNAVFISAHVHKCARRLQGIGLQHAPKRSEARTD